MEGDARGNRCFLLSLFFSFFLLFLLHPALSHLYSSSLFLHFLYRSSHFSRGLPLRACRLYFLSPTSIVSATVTQNLWSNNYSDTHYLNEQRRHASYQASVEGGSAANTRNNHLDLFKANAVSIRAFRARGGLPQRSAWSSWQGAWSQQRLAKKGKLRRKQAGFAYLRTSLRMARKIEISFTVDRHHDVRGHDHPPNHIIMNSINSFIHHGCM